MTDHPPHVCCPVHCSAGCVWPVRRVPACAHLRPVWHLQASAFYTIVRCSDTVLQSHACTALVIGHALLVLVVSSSSTYRQLHTSALIERSFVLCTHRQLGVGPVAVTSGLIGSGLSGVIAGYSNSES